MQESLAHYFSQLEDPRSLRNQRHSLITLIGTSLLAALCGIDSFSGIEDFVEMHFEKLSQHFDFPHGPASHDTYRRLWDSLSPTQFYACFSDFLESLKEVLSDVISLDGKTIRNSGKDKAIQIVSAWCHNNQMVFGQVKVGSNSNEITAIPELLKLLDLRDKVITIDSIGAQRAICSQITESEGDYVIALKKNQGNLHKDVQNYLQDPHSELLINENYDKGHGRLERRVSEVSHDIEWLQERHKWPGLKSIGKITASVLKKGKTSSRPGP